MQEVYRATHIFLFFCYVYLLRHEIMTEWVYRITAGEKMIRGKSHEKCDRNHSTPV